jgi:REP element-mobilizing transposase RayT
MSREISDLPENRRSVERRKRLQALLDSGLGSCVLCRPDCAKIVEDSLLFGHGERYRLLSWVVMPNHVHVLIQQCDNWPLWKVVQSWKRHTSREIQNILGPQTFNGVGKTPLWQRDYWDRYIRDERHFYAAKQYIEYNPVEAGLVKKASDWLFGSGGGGKGKQNI